MWIDPIARPSSSTAEQRTFNPLVLGSNPRGVTTHISAYSHESGAMVAVAIDYFHSFRQSPCQNNAAKRVDSGLLVTML